MDHYAKLRKVMQNNNHKEFAKKLDHALPVVKKQILNELVLDLANIDATSFEVYFDTLLQYDTTHAGVISISTLSPGSRTRIRSLWPKPC